MSEALDAATILGKRFDFSFSASLPFWVIQDYEWAKLTAHRDILRNWAIYSGYSREFNVAIEPSRQYTVAAIKKFPMDQLYRAEYIAPPGEEGNGNPTNALHVAAVGMLIRFDGQEILKIRTICNTVVKVAVRDILRTGTRMCKSCDKKLLKEAGKN